MTIVAELDPKNEIFTKVMRSRSRVKRLRSQAEAVVEAAKAQVERIILGEEGVCDDD